MRYTIPMPGPDEFVKNDYIRDGKCCLLGWARLADGMDPEPEFPRNKNDGPMTVAVKNIIGKGSRDFSVELFNNTHTARECCNVYRKAAKRLGYVVENKPWKAGKR